MKINIHHPTNSYHSFRASKVKSLFNAEDDCDFRLEADLDIDDPNWTIGMIVGPSGSGKSSLGRQVFGKESIVDHTQGWAKDKPIIDCIAPNGDFLEVTSALSGVGLGSVPSWLRPFHALSNGEQFRAGLARLIVERPKQAVVDEFTSVVDRQIAKIGSHAFQKAWRRSNQGEQIILITPHYDVLDWIQPDWVFDTKTNQFDRGSLRRRPTLELQIFETNGSYWEAFEPHYYLKLPRPVAARYFVGTVNGELVCHLAVSPLFTANAYRATRLVTMPEWQGAGVGIKFLEYICQYHLDGNGTKGRKLSTFFHTSHPQLAMALRHRKKWIQTRASLIGDKGKPRTTYDGKVIPSFGGHFRPIQAFKYVGENHENLLVR